MDHTRDEVTEITDFSKIWAAMGVDTGEETIPGVAIDALDHTVIHAPAPDFHPVTEASVPGELAAAVSVSVDDTVEYELPHDHRVELASLSVPKPIAPAALAVSKPAMVRRGTVPDIVMPIPVPQPIQPVLRPSKASSNGAREYEAAGSTSWCVG